MGFFPVLLLLGIGRIADQFAFRALCWFLFGVGRPVPVTLSAVYREIFAILVLSWWIQCPCSQLFIKMFKFYSMVNKAKTTRQKKNVRTNYNYWNPNCIRIFLFNTLNNLYALVNERSGKAPNVITLIRLCLVMYCMNAVQMKYHSKEEIVVIKDYVALWAGTLWRPPGYFIEFFRWYWRSHDTADVISAFCGRMRSNMEQRNNWVKYGWVSTCL